MSNGNGVKRFYVVKVQVDGGWMNAEGLTPTKYKTIETASRARNRFAKKYPTSKYKVVTVITKQAA